MIYAYQDGKRIRIDEYVDGPVFCDEGHPLIVKKGDVRMHHFAHKSGVVCSSDKGMTDMHKFWQSRVPIENREVRMAHHIADICIGEYVVEIQHSPMIESVMRERESFYTKDHKLIWVFDTSMWSYTIDKKGDKAIVRKRSGHDFPLLGAYTGKVIKILDFGKRELFVVEKQRGKNLEGRIIDLPTFDKMIGTTCDDYRPFHHNL